MYGIDISEHQNKDFHLTPYADGQHFVILRAGYGRGGVDKCFHGFADRCEALGIPYGVYWYSYATEPSGGEAEAKAMLEVIRGRKISCGVWIDMEDADHYKQKNGALTQRVCTGVCKSFCDVIAAAGYHAGIYASSSWFHPNGYIKDTYGYDKWIASYWDGTDRKAADFASRCSIWQYRGAPLDLDRMFVSLSWFGGEAPAMPEKTVDELARMVLNGDFGNGEARRIALGDRYNEVQRRVNELISGKAAEPEDEILTLAYRVIAGEFGNGLTRQIRLGSKYSAVQAEVNRILYNK